MKCEIPWRMSSQHGARHGGPYLRPRNLLAAAAFAGVIAAGLGLVNRQVDFGHRNACSGRLSGIAIGMHVYLDRFGVFPPAFINDNNGRPAHSWRVLILPYVGHADLYAEYDFREPWNGPNNRLLMQKRPELYGCPADTDSRLSGETNYVMVTGPTAAFNGEAPVTFPTSGAAYMVLAVETCDSGINWLEPRDLDLRTMDVLVGVPTGNNISSFHYIGAFGVAVNCHRFILEPGPEAELRALFEPDSPRHRAVAQRLFGGRVNGYFKVHVP